MKFVVVYSNMYGSIDILHHNKMIITQELKTIILYLILTIQGLSGKYPAILNISRTGRVAFM